jgi:hypothetical protein
MKALRRFGLGLGLGLGLAAAGPAAAQGWQLAGQVNATAVMFTPGPGQAIYNVGDITLLNDPAANTMQQVHRTAVADNGGDSVAQFQGQVGLLRAYAAASYPVCCSIDGTVVTTGYASGSATGSFYDTITVSGAGLAMGTPVRYEVDLDVSGRISSPSFELGGYLSAFGLANVLLRDLNSFEEVSINWDASRQTSGRYTLGLDTVVGHRLLLGGSLSAGASVNAYATLARWAEADLGHSAGYSLRPSVAGLNTLGASGHDFLAPVPEPTGWALMAGGLLALALQRRAAVQRLA